MPNQLELLSSTQLATQLLILTAILDILTLIKVSTETLEGGEGG